MAKKYNDGKNQTLGFGSLDYVSAVSDLTIFPDPGARNLKDPDWINKDRLYKEFSMLRPQYS